jgi:hypothetical protein
MPAPVLQQVDECLQVTGLDILTDQICARIDFGDHTLNAVAPSNGRKKIESMNNPEFTELERVRPDFLCFLVAIAAASYALTYEWRVDHVVACCRQWLVKNRQIALKIARQDLLKAGVAVRLSSVTALFTNEMELNGASTMVQRMMVLCHDAL